MNKMLQYNIEANTSLRSSRSTSLYMKAATQALSYIEMMEHGSMNQCLSMKLKSTKAKAISVTPSLSGSKSFLDVTHHDSLNLRLTEGHTKHVEQSMKTISLKAKVIAVDPSLSNPKSFLDVTHHSRLKFRMINRQSKHREKVMKTRTANAKTVAAYPSLSEPKSLLDVTHHVSLIK